MSQRRIARHLGVVHQTVANWAMAYAATLPDAPPPPAHDRQLFRRAHPNYPAHVFQFICP